MLDLEVCYYNLTLRHLSTTLVSKGLLENRCILFLKMCFGSYQQPVEKSFII